jgi:hypothetical protein
MRVRFVAVLAAVLGASFAGAAGAAGNPAGVEQRAGLATPSAAGTSSAPCVLPRPTNGVSVRYFIVQGHATSATFSLKDEVICGYPNRRVNIVAYLVHDGHAVKGSSASGECTMTARDTSCRRAAGSKVTKVTSHASGLWAVKGTYSMQGPDAIRMFNYGAGCTFVVTSLTATCPFASERAIRLP